MGCKLWSIFNIQVSLYFYDFVDCSLLLLDSISPCVRDVLDIMMVFWTKPTFYIHTGILLSLKRNAYYFSEF